ncbi:MAG: glycosyltransferase [Candidatus Micrarchaeota archaeon]
MDAYVCLYEHPVYNSLLKVFRNIRGIDVRKVEDYSKKTKQIFRTKSFHIQKLEMELTKENMYILPSPIMAIETWGARLKGIPAFMVEEYSKKSTVKDIAIGALLFPFRNYPFISLTKRTHRFLSNRSFTSFHVPPAETKRRGSRNRDIILFTGKMIETKNPTFAVDLAKELKDEHFVVVGKGPLSDMVKEKASGVGNLEIIDFVETREKLFRDYYGKAKVLIHPAFSDPIAFVIVEALSTSTPVLASESVGASDYLPAKWRMSDYGVKRWADAIRNIDSESIKEAEETFTRENLNIDSQYFNKSAESMNTFIGERGWLTKQRTAE